MRNRTRMLLLNGVALAVVLGGVGWALRTPATRPSGAGAGAGADQAARPGAARYDIAPLRRPPRRYFGAILPGVPASTRPLDAFTTLVGKRPNLVGYFQQYGDTLDTRHLRTIHRAGALPMVQIEPKRVPIRDIAAGRTDRYLRDYAAAVRAANIPVVLSVGHEMNGDWYRWGTADTDPGDFVAAWRRMRRIFRDTDVHNALFLWNVNIVNTRPDVDIATLYPGDADVDWVGMTGYFNARSTRAHSFRQLFGPTMRAVRRFTDKPMIIAETGAAADADKARQVADLLAEVRRTPDIIGVVWFNYHKSGRFEADWRVQSDQRSVRAFRRGIAHPAYGFPIPGGDPPGPRAPASRR